VHDSVGFFVHAHAFNNAKGEWSSIDIDLALPGQHIVLVMPTCDAKSRDLVTTT
jgi:hypothetical protein